MMSAARKKPSSPFLMKISLDDGVKGQLRKVWRGVESD